MQKIARLCWNSQSWEYPSGKNGKNSNADSYEYMYGFGWEEWLLDTSKLIDGYHYGYIQGIANHHEKYYRESMEQGKNYDIYLYSIENKSKQRYWLGVIKDVQIISKEESAEVYKEYKKKGWLNEMEEQLLHVGANIDSFYSDAHQGEGFAVLKYKPKNLKLHNSALPFSKDDPAVPSFYYSNLLNFQGEPTSFPNDYYQPDKKSKSFIFKAGHNKRNENNYVYLTKQSTNEKTQIHNSIQNSIFNQFCQKYGENNVGTEQFIEGTFIDLVIKMREDEYIFFEIKTASSPKLCIRESIGQLLEYGYYHNINITVKKFIIVGYHSIDADAKQYLNRLKEKSNLPIFYIHLNLETQKLEDYVFDLINIQ